MNTTDPPDPPKKEADASTPATEKTAPVTANDAIPAAASKEIRHPGVSPAMLAAAGVLHVSAAAARFG